MNRGLHNINNMRVHFNSCLGEKSFTAFPSTPTIDEQFAALSCNQIKYNSIYQKQFIITDTNQKDCKKLAINTIVDTNFNLNDFFTFSISN